jgi:hypothetical protein
MGSALQQMSYYHENSIILHESDPAKADIGLTGKIVVGRFLDLDKPTFSDFQRGGAK